MSSKPILQQRKKLKIGECDRLHTQSIMVMFLFHEVLF